MEHDVSLTCADGSVRKFCIYGRAAPCVGEVVTLPIDGKLTKVRIDKLKGGEFVGSIDQVETSEIEAA